MKIGTYNVNGIRAAVKKGLLDWISDKDVDILGFQETKAQDDQLPIEKLEDMGYCLHHCAAEKKGYSGVLTISKEQPDEVIKGIGIEKFDKEGRVIMTRFGDLAVYNCYFPSGSSSEERHQIKMEFLDAFWPFILDQKKKYKDIVVMGDYNVVHGDLDIHNPQRKDNPSGFRPEERQWMDMWFSEAFHDAFRVLHPETQEFSWWSYRAGSRDRNKGWRIDYMSINDSMRERLKSYEHFKDDKHSDHCGIIASFEK